MTEDFLHYIWKFQLFEKKNLRCADGRLLEIVHPGYHNHNAGPDFSEARVKIGGQMWAGNLEIHIRSSDWRRHNHQADQAYQNVILHVVYEHDEEVPDVNGEPLAVLQLKGIFDEYPYWRYEQLMAAADPIPCAAQFPQVDELVRESMLERCLVERLEEKTRQIEQLYQQNKNDWNETFYQWMARGFGLKVNAEPMLMLAQWLPQKVLAHHKDRLFQLEALLFGVSGLLNDQDDYARELKAEFGFLNRKYHLNVMNPVSWKYARLRPAGFPDLRIGQFAALVHRSDNLFSKILGVGSLQVLEQLLSDSPSVYWREHYRLGNPHQRTKAGVGQAFQEILVVNVIVPFLFIYGKAKGESFYQQRAFDLLDQMAPENNKVTRIFKSLGMQMYSAHSSQGILQLYNNYCSRKKCLNCQIGSNILKS